MSLPTVRRSILPLRRLRFALCALAIMTAAAAWGTSYTWNAGANGSWSVAANWLPNTGFPGSAAGDTATIDTPYTVTMNAALANPLASITLSSTAQVAVAGHDLTINGPASLGSTNATAAFSNNSGTGGSVTFNGAVTLAANTTFRQRTANGTFTVNFNNTVDGPYNLTLNSGSTLRNVAATATAAIGSSSTPIANLTLTYSTLNMGSNDLWMTGNLVPSTTAAGLTSTGTVYMAGAGM